MRISELIVEAVAASPVLYHGTPADNLPSILQARAILPSDNGRTSASRSRKRVEQTYGDQAYFVLDQRKIAQRQNIIPVDWKYGSKLVGGHFPWDPGALDDREDAEESIKGPVKLDAVLELVLNATQTFNEIVWEEHVKQHPETRDLYQGLLYSDRMEEYQGYAKQFAKLGIKTTFKKY